MSDPADVFDLVGLTEYEATALEELLSLGRTTAPNLAEASGIPKARVYGVLESLSDRGFIKVIPGRPKEYQPKSPGDILDRAVENRRQSYESFTADIDSYRDSFLAEYEPRFERASEDISPTAELFHVVDVGEPSERETRRLYDDAEETLRVITNSFAYLDNVERALAETLDRGVDISVLFLHPDALPPEKAAVQADIIDRLTAEYPAVDLRFSTEKLPWRGTLVDPSMDYDSGEAILLVEEPDVPNHMRQAAITDNGSFVAGMKRYFDLIWEYESVPTARQT
ncbi:TrmB family transcriptional regulator [Haloarcula argentinensis]|uniref:Transcriptional regulator n=1 Tax=Haloarcula argentinensis TaxID=43776 RepID=A0A830FQC7_HALAR|nr:helix-turn-helix domain-containing protein [Haloarcula argentinensis]EMA24835.1 sugar-specific transcriptional regulator [Haloarcula argentinensis DSM 12282]MDS0253051.1 TrmB family transcriptional regulator [Haloarcula argentinensis]GGM27478.1 transcriptional regulator [Haloarcula argentinensis]